VPYSKGHGAAHPRSAQRRRDLTGAGAQSPAESSSSSMFDTRSTSSCGSRGWSPWRSRRHSEPVDDHGLADARSLEPLELSQMPSWGCVSAGRGARAPVAGACRRGRCRRPSRTRCGCALPACGIHEKRRARGPCAAPRGARVRRYAAARSQEFGQVGRRCRGRGWPPLDNAHGRQPARTPTTHLAPIGVRSTCRSPYRPQRRRGRHRYASRRTAVRIMSG